MIIINYCILIMMTNI